MTTNSSTAFIVLISASAALLLASVPVQAQAPSAGMPTKPGGGSCEKKHRPKLGACVVQSDKERRLVVEISGVSASDGAPEGAESRIESALAKTAGQLMGCYESALERDGSLAGSLQMTFFVRPEGAHETIELASNPLDEPAETCIRAGLLQAKLPEPGSGEYEVSASFNFRQESTEKDEEGSEGEEGGKGEEGQDEG